MQAYDRVKAARQVSRPTAQVIIENIFTDFFELHGDRLFGDDRAIVGGLARLGGRPVTVIGLEKGVNTSEKVLRNFGSAHPEGYRKALRLMLQAEKFRRPIFCIVDTSGAYCGIGAEERGQGSAIANNLAQMMGLSVPVITLVAGEGGSGGALALAVANQVWMLENAVYSVISPEGAASILYKDPAMAAEASENLKLTAEDLLGLGVIERIFSEQQGFDRVYSDLKLALVAAFKEYDALSGETLAAMRYEKFRNIGRVQA